MKTAEIKPRVSATWQRTYMLLITCAVLFVSLDKPALAQCGNKSGQELGDAVYRKLDGALGWLANYNHAAVFVGFDLSQHSWVAESVGGSSDSTKTNTFSWPSQYASDYYGAYTLDNMTLSFTGRRNIAKTASDLVNAFIYYPTVTDIIPRSLLWYGTRFDGSISDIYALRCDGLVEYSYEKNNLVVWWNTTKPSSQWSIVRYPDNHNDRPDVTCNPERELSPWAQRGAPTSCGNPCVGSWSQGNTHLRASAKVLKPTYQVTQVKGRGYADVTVKATDESGIYLIAIKPPGSSSYIYVWQGLPSGNWISCTIRCRTKGIFYYYAVDQGGNFGNTQSVSVSF